MAGCPTKTSVTGSENTDATAGGTKVPARGRTAASGGKPLVIVESPTKATKIAGYLGSGYNVEASVGHIRDLPRNAADVPAEHKGAAWARLGVDVDNSFGTPARRLRTTISTDDLEFFHVEESDVFDTLAATAEAQGYEVKKVYPSKEKQDNVEQAADLLKAMNVAPPQFVERRRKPRTGKAYDIAR